MFVAWLERLKKLPRVPACFERHLVALGRDISRSNQDDFKSEKSTLWVDISVINRRDAGTGIQRVVRALITELQHISIPGWRILPVAATPRQPYRVVSWRIPEINTESTQKMQPKAGDIFLGLDLSAHIIPRYQQQMAQWKSQGLKLVFVIYDLLPLNYPQWFSAKLVRAFRRWIKSVAILADEVFCISHPVKQDFENLMVLRYGLQPDTIPAYVFPMGANIEATQPSNGLPEGFSDSLHVIGQSKSVLMVGTIEPRKGHGQMLDVFEYLWRKGVIHRLVIVGRPGWMTESLQHRITRSCYFNDRLFWFSNASDEALHLLYENCSGVILASHAEGFGLPLLEALSHGKPVLARNLDVFHEFSSPLVTYFTENFSTESIGAAVETWIESIDDVAASQLNNMIQLPTWRTSLNSLLEQLLPEGAFVKQNRVLA